MAASSTSSQSQPPPIPLPTVVVGDDDDVDVGALIASESVVANLADLVARNARERPTDLALIQPGDERATSTWSELDEQVSAIAAGLARQGVLAGHRLALRGPTSMSYVVCYLAALRAGVVAVPLGQRAGSELSTRWLAESGARLLLTTSGFELESDIRALPLTPDGLAGLAEPAGTPVVSPPDREALAVLLYTAGTAEEPRPVMLTHRSLLANRDVGPGRPEADSVVAAALPLSGAYGLVAVLGSWIEAGCRLVVADERADLAAVIAAESVTHLPVSPPQIFRLLQRAAHAHADLPQADLPQADLPQADLPQADLPQADLPQTDLRGALHTVRSVVSAGARLPWPLTREFTERTGLRIEQAYGLTETPRGVTSTLGGELLGPGHVGRALPGVDIRIGDGREDEPDEIWVRGEMLFSGYWPSGTGGPGEDGWWNTGDLGYLRGDELFVLDRARDLLVVSGFTIYPAEIEQSIAEVEGVDAVAVIGAPTAGGGQRMLAFIEGSATPDEVLAHCRRLATYKRPKEVRVVERLPRTHTGLIRRGALRRLLAVEADG